MPNFEKPQEASSSVFENEVRKMHGLSHEQFVVWNKMVHKDEIAIPQELHERLRAEPSISLDIVAEKAIEWLKENPGFVEQKFKEVE